MGKEFVKVKNFISKFLNFILCSRLGVHNLGDMPPWGDARGSRSVTSWVHLYQRGDTIDIKGDAEAKRLGTPVIDNLRTANNLNIFYLNDYQTSVQIQIDLSY